LLALKQTLEVFASRASPFAKLKTFLPHFRSENLVPELRSPAISASEPRFPSTEAVYTHFRH
jgi:hypothetical protein